MSKKFITSSTSIALITLGLSVSVAFAQSAPPQSSPPPPPSGTQQPPSSGTQTPPPQSYPNQYQGSSTASYSTYNNNSTSSYPGQQPPYPAQYGSSTPPSYPPQQYGSSTQPYSQPQPYQYGSSTQPMPPQYSSQQYPQYPVTGSSSMSYPMPQVMLGSSTMPNLTPDMIKMMNSMYQNFQQGQGQQGQQNGQGQGQNQWQQVQQQLQSQGYGFGDDQSAMMDDQHQQMMQQMLQHFRMITKQLLRMENQLKNRLAILQKRGFAAPQDCTNVISAIDTMRITVQNASSTSDMSGFREQSDFMDNAQSCRSEVEELLSVSNMIKKAPTFLRWIQKAGVDISALQSEYDGLASQLATFKTTPATGDQIDSFFDALDSFKADAESAMGDANLTLPASLQQLDQIEQQYRQMNNNPGGPQSNAQTQTKVAGTGSTYQKNILDSLKAQLGAAAAGLQGIIHR